MEKVLVISSNEKATSMIIQLVKETAHCNISIVESGIEARRAVGCNCEYDLVIINSPLKDEFGNELAEFITDKTMAN